MRINDGKGKGKAKKKQKKKTGGELQPAEWRISWQKMHSRNRRRSTWRWRSQRSRRTRWRRRISNNPLH